jgi:hypothetical protein
MMILARRDNGTMVQSERKLVHDEVDEECRRF